MGENINEVLGLDNNNPQSYNNPQRIHYDEGATTPCKVMSNVFYICGIASGLLLLLIIFDSVEFFKVINIIIGSDDAVKLYLQSLNSGGGEGMRMALSMVISAKIYLLLSTLLSFALGALFGALCPIIRRNTMR